MSASQALPMKGRVVLVTGATSGIGLVTARELARLGAQVIVVSRSPSRCAEVVRQIVEATGNPDVLAMPADLSSLGEVRALAERVRREVGQLDVLVNNAGAIFGERKLSVDGFEMTWALNHLNYFLLSNLLLDLLKASPQGRVVNVSSDAHFAVRRADFSDVNFERRRYEGFAAYCLSKLANVMFTYELARRLEGSTVTANALHPGAVATNFGRNNRGLLGLVFRLFSRFALTPEQGAQTSIYLAASPEVANVSGKYFDRCKPKPSSAASYDAEAQRRLWALSEAQVGL